MKKLLISTTACLIFVSASISAKSANRYGNKMEADGNTGEVKASSTPFPDRSSASFKAILRPEIKEKPDKARLRAFGENKYSAGFGTAKKSTGKSIKPSEELNNLSGRAFKNLLSGEAKPASKYRGERTVFGRDDRVEITDGTRYPYRTIGLFEITHDDWKSYGHCSATLISESTALTAAHCVYDHDQGWFDQGLIYPGATSEESPYGGFKVEDATIMQGYIDNWSGSYDWNIIPHDMAILKLSGNPGRRLGTLPVGYFAPPKDFTGNIVGYPGDKAYGSMWRSSCSFLAYNIESTTAEHFCDTAPGNSGSSVYDYEQRDKSRVIIGVDVAGSSQSQTAVYFDEAYFHWICNVVRDFEGRNICH